MKAVALDTVATLDGSAIGVLVIDDQAAVRNGLMRLISSSTLQLRAAHAVATGAEAVQAAGWLRPDVAVLDVDLAGEDGLALISRLAPAAVLVLTCHGDPGTRKRAALLGAAAFVEKHKPAAELLAALAHIATLRSRGEETPGRQGETSHLAAVASSAAPEPGGT